MYVQIVLYVRKYACTNSIIRCIAGCQSYRVADPQYTHSGDVCPPHPLPTYFYTDKYIYGRSGMWGKNGRNIVC